MNLAFDNENRAISEWNKFEKVEGLLKTCNEYLSCYQKLKDTGKLVVVGSSGDKAPRHLVDEVEWKTLSEEEKLEKLYETAKTANNDMLNLCEKLSNFSDHVLVGPLKEKRRVIEKRERDYNGDVLRVIDIVRCSVLLKSLKFAKEILASFKPGGKWAAKWMLVRCKDGFQHADNFLAGGYRDIKVNVRHIDTGHIVEIQLHLEPFYEIKSCGGHEYYTFARTLNVDGITNAVSVLSGSSNSLNWKIATVGENQLTDAGEDPTLRYPIERRLGELYASMWCHGKHAIVMYDAALRHCVETHGKEAEDYLKILMELVYCCSEMQRHSNRENMRSEDEKWMTIDLIPMIDEAIDGLTLLYSESHPYTMKAMRIKADVYDSCKNLTDTAKSLYYKVLDMQTEILGISHPDTIETLNNFGDLLTDSEATVVEGFQKYETGLEGSLKRMYYNHPTPRMLVGNMVAVLQEDGWDKFLGGARRIPDGNKKLKKYKELEERQNTAQNFETL